MIIDYHMHLERDDHIEACRFTVDRISTYVDAARARGVDEIGVSEHCNRFTAFESIMSHLVHGEDVHQVQRDWMMRSFREDLGQYVDALQAARRGGLPVKTSLEVDYIPGAEKQTEEILAQYPFDYIIGSVHFLGTWGVDLAPSIGWPKADVDAVYVEYFETMNRAARSGLFDILAHPDLVKKFGHRPSFDMTDLYASLADAAKEGGVSMEISTAGLYKPVEELYPAQPLLTLLRDRDVPITLASDAHEPDHIGRGFDRALAAASAAGYDTSTRFDERRPKQVPLG